MDISVAIITHNRASFLRKCLQSIVEQTRRPDEVIVVDNGSTDQTKHIALQFKRNLPLRYFYRSQPGYSHNRNFALKKCTYSAIAWIDDDCTAFPDWLTEIEKALQIGLYLFQGVDIDDKSNIYSYAQNLRTDEFRYFSEQLLDFHVELSEKKAKKIYGIHKKMIFPSINSVDHRSFVYRKEILNALPYWYNKSLPPYFSADEWDILRRIRNAGYFVLLNPRIKVIHHGRSTFWAFIKRQIQYGQNDAIRERLDRERRRKINKLKLYIKSSALRKFMYTDKLWLSSNIRIIRNVLGDNISAYKKIAVLSLFLLGKLLRFTGKMYEQGVMKVNNTYWSDL